MSSTEKNTPVSLPLIFRGYNPTGQWMAEFSIDQAETYTETEERSSDDVEQMDTWKELFTLGDQANRYLGESLPIKDAGQRKVYLKKVEKFLLEKVQVLRVSGDVNKDDSERPFIPRLLAARIKLNQLKMQLPDSGEKKVFLKLKFSTPLYANVILDNPFVRNDTAADYEFAFIVTSFFFNIQFGAGLSWPDFIDKSNTKIEIYTGTKASEVAVNPTALFSTYLKLPMPAVNDELHVHAGGMTYAGKMPLPWKDGNAIHGDYQLVKDMATGNFSLVIKNNLDWKNELLRYQDDVVDATDELKNEFNAPLRSSPASGLIASVVRDEIRWAYRNDLLSYDPGNSLFELEFRGSAGGTSRVSPDSVALAAMGKKIIFSSGAVNEDDDYIDYYYERATGLNVWKGSFDMALEPDAFRALLEKTGQQKLDDFYHFWILTPQGPLALPLPPPLLEDDGVSSDPQAVSQSIIRGILRLSAVPWTRSEIQGLAFPDLEKERNGSLLLTEARGVVATFEFSTKEKLQCDKIHVRIMEPLVRMEELLPVFLPENNDQPDPYKPPRLPSPAKSASPPILFYGLSFIRNAASRDQLSNVNWQMNLDYRPGMTDDLLEGSWNNSHLSLNLTRQAASKSMYWFHPDNAFLVPSLPYQQDPSQLVERVCRNRLFMPFEPVADKNIDFQFGESWYTPTVKSGTFKPARQDDSHSSNEFFEWSHLLLPGISITATTGKPLTIINGRLAGENLILKWRNDLPVLDEIQALMAAGKKKDEERSDTVGISWWNKLVEMKALSTGMDTILVENEFLIDSEKIIGALNFPVEIRNLIGRGSFAGFLNVSLSESSASLFINDSHGNKINLVTEDALLKGPTAKFRYDQHVLMPVSGGVYDTEITASSVMPFSIQRGNDKVFLDQHGNFFSPVLEEAAHRKITVYVPEKNGAVNYFLWSAPSLDLAIPGTNVSLYFKGIPLCHDENGKWQFNNEEIPENPLLKEFNWGTIGSIYINQFLFQPFQLEQLIVETAAGQIPTEPLKIVLSGVLHFVPSVSLISDKERQQIMVTFIRNNGLWSIESIGGKILWPLYQKAPDISEAKESDLRTIYPYIESAISFSNHKIVFGNAASPPQLIFSFLQKVWASNIIPVRISPESIEWEIVSQPENEGLYPFAGKIFLVNNKIVSSVIDFRIAVITKTGNHHLANVEFTYTFNNSESQVRITSFKLFQRNEMLLLTDHVDQLFFNSNQLVITVNEKAGFRKEKEILYLLPGWPLDPEAGLCGYLQLGFTSDLTAQRVLQTPVSSFFMALESSVKTPEPLHVAIEYKHTSGTEPVWGIHLTGQARFTNVFRWKPDVEKICTHEITFTLLNALLPGSQLDFSSDENTLFDLAFTENDEQALSGMIEIPGMASHKIVAGSDDQEVTIAAWTAPQQLRLAHPKSAIMKVFGLPDKNIDRGVVPNGFYGELGILLKELLENSKTMILDATDVFWLRPFSDLDNNRAEASLWQETEFILKGIPAGRQDFSKKNTIPWTRTPVPFIQDSENIISGALQSDEILQNLTLISSASSLTGENQSNLIIQQEALDNQSLEYPMLYSLEKTVFAFVEINAAANEHLIPYMAVDKEHEPAWVAFDNQYAKENSENILLIRKKTSFRPGDHLRRFYYYEFPIQLKESGEYSIELKVSSRWKDTLVIITAGEDSYSLLNIPYTASDSKNATLTSTINLDKKDKKITISAVRHLLDVDQVSLCLTKRKIYENRIKGVDFESASREGINQIIKIKNKVKPPIDTDDWLEYAIDIPFDNDYVIDFNIDMFTDDTEFTFRQSNKGVGELLVVKNIENNKPVTIRTNVSLKKGKRKFRIICTKSSFRLLWFQITLYSQRILPTPFETSAVAVRQVTAYAQQTFLAATEILPSTKVGKLSWQRITDAFGRSKPYFLASPLVRLNKSRVLPIDDDVNFKITVDIIVAFSDSWKNDGREIFSPFASSSFIIGINDNDSWESILFGVNESNLIRKRVIDWVIQFQQRLPLGSTALLRARTLYSTGAIQAVKYFVLNTKNQTSQQLSVPVILSTKYPLLKDIHYERLTDYLDDTLMKGPDYLGGKVYYVPLDWHESPLPTLPDNKFEKIRFFSIDKNEIKAGEAVKLSWELNEIDPGLTTLIEVKDQEIVYYPEENKITVYPEQSSVFVLTLLSKQNIKIEQASLGIRVKVPVSGSGVGISYKLTGVAPGPLNATRQPLRKDRNNFHRWVEITRDVEFLNLTRSDAVSKNETGWTLPPSRKLKTTDGFDPSVLSPFLATRANILFTGGRSGSLTTIRNSFLNQDVNNLLARTNSIIFQVRHPRPVPLHESLLPAAPSLEGETGDFNVLPTCLVREMPASPPFHYREIKWRDPLYDKKLQAAQQDIENSWGKLMLDRKVYSGKDLFYPELSIEPGKLSSGWEITLTFYVERVIQGVLRKITEMVIRVSKEQLLLLGLAKNVTLDPNAIVKEIKAIQVRRYVFAIGLNQPLAVDSLFNLELNNMDQLTVQAQLKNSADVMRLKAIIRTDEEVWSQPQNAYALLRRKNTSGEIALAAFGWLQKPKIVKRSNRFVNNSWTATFHYADTFLLPSHEENVFIDYEVRSISPYGEQTMKKPFQTV